MEDLNRALTLMEQAVASTSNTHPEFAMYLDHLGNVLLDKFERAGLTEDMNRAITIKK
jgi:hypothetical protein